MAAKLDMDKLVSLCRRRGFIFQSSEIYGGINGFWDYGPLGVELKKNIKDAWWQDMVRNPPPGPDGQEITMVGLDCSIIMNPKVWEASGHVGGFSDPMVDCLTCKRRFRADKVWFVRAVQRAVSMPSPGRIASDAEVRWLAIEANSRDEALKAFHGLPLRKKRTIFGDANLEDLDSYDAKSAPSDWKRPCPIDGCDGRLTEPRSFNLMFQTY